MTTLALVTPTPRTVIAAAVCPLCHTAAAAFSAGDGPGDDSWMCATCGQRWSARRLETVAAYAEYVAAHDAPARSVVTR